MTQESNKTAVLQFWYVLEQLNPYDLSPITKKLNAASINYGDDELLPWINPEVLTEKFRLPSIKNGKTSKYDFQVYLGIFSLESVFDFLQSLPKPASSDFEDLAPSTKQNLSCYASFLVDSNGLLVDGSLTCSTVPWSLKRIGELLTSNRQMNLDKWTEDFNEHMKLLKEKFSSLANQKITLSKLNNLLDLICEGQWQSKEFKCLGYYVFQSTDSNPDDTTSDILNSFYLSDLAAAVNAIKTGEASKPLQQYLTDIRPSPTKVEEIGFLQQWLSPEYIPHGRWASDPAHNLSLMQQVAVNLAINELKDKGGLFSVNGPPGTGKTTLLRDLIADLVVQRAEKLIIYDKPTAAFRKIDGVYLPHSSITGFEVVVASTNNSAVENITVELPSLDTIASQYQEKATYLRTVAESVKDAAKKQPDRSNSAYSDVPIEALTPPDDEELDLPENIIPSSTWGLIAAALGNKPNCHRFCQGFWSDLENSIGSLLDEEIDISKWNESRQKYSQCREIVKQIILQKTQLKDKLGHGDCWSRPIAEVQLSAPWVDRELNDARTQLFLAALDVHEQFLRRSASPIRQNLRRWVKLVKGNSVGLKNDQILYLWQTLFLVVPVISTAFASIQRLFGRLRPESLGWLLIDEAGQGVPQAAVGALQRVKRAVIVGDPLQIEPVVTLDKAIIKGLQGCFNVDAHWSPTEASIQTLGDRANPFGTSIKIDGERLWIGCPLWVHRRCITPMFEIANKMAYDNKMVTATTPPEGKKFPLGDSRWIDIEGKCKEGNYWVLAQGEEVVQLLTQAVESEKALPNLYIISPFKTVSSELKSLLKNNFKWAAGLTGVKEWIKRSVGTVHAFQGKEADAVIFILGADEKSQGAIGWASSKPNILNVAVTRAKYRFYIIGSRKLWSGLPFFSEASHWLPYETRPSTPPPDEARPLIARPVLKPKIQN